MSVFPVLLMLMLALSVPNANGGPTRDSSQGTKDRFPRSKQSPNIRGLTKQVKDLKQLLQDFGWNRLTTIHVLVLVMAFSVIPSILIVNTALSCWILQAIPANDTDHSTIGLPRNSPVLPRSLDNLSDSFEAITSAASETPPPSYNETMGRGYPSVTNRQEVVDLDYLQMTASYGRPIPSVDSTWQLGPPLQLRQTTV